MRKSKPIDNELRLRADLARETSRRLSYDSGLSVGSAKHLLLELASLVDSRNVGAYWRDGKLLFVSANFAKRRATRKEYLLYVLFGVIPRKI